MDIGKAFGFVFEDEEWVSKILIGGLVSLVPILNFASAGYILKTAENVARGESRPLPRWSDFGDLFMRGLYYIVIWIVYQLPTIVLYCVLIGVSIGMGSAMESNSDSAAGGVLVALACIYPLLFVFAILGTITSYIAAARYIASGVFSDAFKFGEVFSSLRANLGKWVIFLLVSFLASIVGGLGFIACFIGVIFTSAYAYAVIGHALGQTMRELGLVGPASYSTDTIPPYTPPTTYQ